MKVNSINQTNFNGAIYVPGFSSKSDLLCRLASHKIDAIQKRPYDLKIKHDYASKLNIKVTNEKYDNKKNPIVFQGESRTNEMSALNVIDKLMKRMDKQLDIKA